MTDLKESIIEGIKSFLLPELRKLQDGIDDLGKRMDAVEKQIVIMNENILNNSRRIDSLGGRIDELGGRIDEMGGRLDRRIDEMGDRLDRRINEMGARIDQRIDTVHVEFTKVGIELERLKRDEAITADILHRMEIVEERVLLGK